ncbi:PLP-dependent aminotransferase family protein [Sphingomonas sp. RT2P30]|uniref:aminotransferase-like domain-containing protein n=1 Tax=Parasphingomonas halimpatiens TaxID=3096162 RepID=UPI002FC80D26
MSSTVGNAVAGLTRTEDVMRQVRQRIDRRVLTPGARLPSVRSMAQTSGFSKSTVVEAYDRLAAEGVIRSRPGAGFFVAAPLAPLTLAEAGPPRDPQVDPLWMLRQSLAASPAALKPGCGWLPDHWMPDQVIRKALRQIARGAVDGLTDYGPPQGHEALRRLLARRLIDQGVEAGPDQILLTDSATHAIDLVLRFLIEPGDTVLVDDPCYFNFHALLRAHRAKVVGVPYGATGPDLAAFADALATHRPRLYLTNSGVHNPTGATLSAPTAHRILKLAELHDMVVVEDDIYADFEHAPAPRLAAFDGLDRVIRVGSFSKSLSGAVRCGHIAARRDWVAALTDLRIATGMSGSALSAELVHAVLVDGDYRRHLERLRVRLGAARARTIARLAAIGIVPVIKPDAGLFLWCRLPDGPDGLDLTRRGAAENIVFAPGNLFSAAQNAASHMRFNVAMMEDERIYRCLAAG